MAPADFERRFPKTARAIDIYFKSLVCILVILFTIVLISKLTGFQEDKIEAAWDFLQTPIVTINF